MDTTNRESSSRFRRRGAGFAEEDPVGSEIVAAYENKAVETVTITQMRTWLTRGAFFFVFEDKENITVYLGPCRKRPKVRVGTFSLKDNYISSQAGDGEEFFRKLTGFFQAFMKKSKLLEGPRSARFHGCSRILRAFDDFEYEATLV